MSAEKDKKITELEQKISKLQETVKDKDQELMEKNKKIEKLQQFQTMVAPLIKSMYPLITPPWYIAFTLQVGGWMQSAPFKIAVPSRVLSSSF